MLQTGYRPQEEDYTGFGPPKRLRLPEDKKDISADTLGFSRMELQFQPFARLKLKLHADKSGGI